MKKQLKEDLTLLKGVLEEERILSGSETIS
jgi:hypothetical protein